MKQKNDINLTDQLIQEQKKPFNWKPIIDIVLHALNSLITYFLTSQN